MSISRKLRKRKMWFGSFLVFDFFPFSFLPTSRRREGAKECELNGTSIYYELFPFFHSWLYIVLLSLLTTLISSSSFVPSLIPSAFSFSFPPLFSRVNFHQSLIPTSELVRLLNESRVKWMIWMENEWVKLERLGERFLSLIFLPFSLFSLSYLNPHPLQNPPCMSCRIKTV